MKSAFVLVALLVAGAAFANDIDPYGFETEHFQFSKPRAEVAADLKVAQAAGQLPEFGEVGVRPLETKSVMTRAQVIAETHEAARLGLLSSYGEAGPKQASFAQEQQIHLAGLRAIGQTTADR